MSKSKRVSVFRILIMAIAFACVMSGIWQFSVSDVHAVPARRDRGTYAGDIGCRSLTFDLITPEDIPSDGKIGVPGSAGRHAKRRAGQAETESYIPLVMIVIGFEGQQYSNEYDWHDLIFEGDQSLGKYYTDMSMGKFTFVPVQETSKSGTDGNTNISDAADDGIIHISLDREKKYGWAIDDDNTDADLEMMTAFYDALTESGSKYIDFQAYDSNNDGEIQNTELAVGFIVSGRDIAARGGYASQAKKYQYIWPYAYSFTEYCEDVSGLPEAPVIDGVKVDNYIAIAETYEKGSGLLPEMLGILAHELGHYIGLPDLYNTLDTGGSWSSYTVDELSLMDSGSYGEDPYGNSTIYSLDIWSKVMLGWVEPETVTEGEYSIEAISSGSEYSGGNDGSDEALPMALRIDTDNPGEYFLIENRRFAGWDEGMYRSYPEAASQDGSEDRGGGLLIWHIDDNIYYKYNPDNTVNVPSHHPAVMPLYEERSGGVTGLTGGSVETSKPFFDAESWQSLNGAQPDGTHNLIPLPVYGSALNDRPADRTGSISRILSIDTGSAPQMQIYCAGAEIGVLEDAEYTGEEITPIPAVTIGGAALTPGTDYTVGYKYNKNVGRAEVNINGTGSYSGRLQTGFTIRKAVQKPVIKAIRKTVKAARLKKKKQVVSGAVKATKFKGTVTYSKTGGSGRLTVNKKTGKITVKKKTKKGTYSIRVRVKVSGNENYLPASKTVTVKIRVR